jgi:hypothetical protein
MEQQLSQVPKCLLHVCKMASMHLQIMQRANQLPYPQQLVAGYQNSEEKKKIFLRVHLLGLICEQCEVLHALFLHAACV